MAHTDENRSQRELLAIISTANPNDISRMADGWSRSASKAESAADRVVDRLNALTTSAQPWRGQAYDAYSARVTSDLVVALRLFATKARFIANHLDVLSRTVHQAVNTAKANPVPWDIDAAWRVDQKKVERSWFSYGDEGVASGDSAYEEAQSKAPYEIKSGSGAVRKEVPKPQWQQTLIAVGSPAVPEVYRRCGAGVGADVVRFDALMEHQGMNTPQKQQLLKSAAQVNAALAGFLSTDHGRPGNESSDSTAVLRAGAVTGGPGGTIGSPTPGGGYGAGISASGGGSSAPNGSGSSYLSPSMETHSSGVVDGTQLPFAMFDSGAAPSVTGAAAWGTGANGIASVPSGMIGGIPEGRVGTNVAGIEPLPATTTSDGRSSTGLFPHGQQPSARGGGMMAGGGFVPTVAGIGIGGIGSGSASNLGKMGQVGQSGTSLTMNQHGRGTLNPGKVGPVATAQVGSGHAAGPAGGILGLGGKRDKKREDEDPELDLMFLDEDRDIWCDPEFVPPGHIR